MSREMVEVLTCNAKNVAAAHRHLNTNLYEPTESTPSPRFGRHLTSDDEHSIIEAYTSGKTARQVATEFSCHRIRVTKILKKHGIQIRNSSPSTAEMIEMARLYDSGLTLAEVGKRLGYSTDTVRRRCHELGVKMRDPRAAKLHK